MRDCAEFRGKFFLCASSYAPNSILLCLLKSMVVPVLSVHGEIVEDMPMFIGIHRWELPVIHYHNIRVFYHYSFLWVKVLVILHYFIRQNQHKKNSDCYHFFLIMVNYPIFPINDHILYFRCIFNIYLSSKNTRTMYQKHVTFCNF